MPERPMQISLIPGKIASKVTIVKWILAGSIWLGGGALALVADQADDLYNQGLAAMSSGDYNSAVQAFDQIIHNYPNSPTIDDVRLRAGFAYLHLGNDDLAIDRLAKETAANAPAADRGTALFYTGLAQLSEGGKLPQGYSRTGKFNDAVRTMTTLIDYLTSSPGNTAQDYLEEAYYNRSLAHFYAGDFAHAEGDVQDLLQKFPDSLSRSDYLLLLGNLYAREASEALAAKKPDADVRGLAAKANAAFDQVIGDNTALVQANQARLAKAEVLYLVATLDSSGADGYQAALEAFRAVERKDDLIPQEQKNLDALIAKNQASVAHAQSTLGNETSRLIDRETGRLAELKSGPDPVIQALIRIAECYNAMKQGDEARTVMHRLIEHGTLAADQRQEVDFALIYSYVLGGDADKADKALTDYLSRHPGDSQAEGISVQLAGSLMKARNYAAALAQADRSLHDFPKGADVAAAIELKAQALTGLNRLAEARTVENDFLRENPSSPAAIGLLLSRAQGAAAQGNLKDALADYKSVGDNNAAGDFQASGAAGYIQTLQALGRNDDVIQASKSFAAKFPKSPLLPNILVMGAVAMDQKHDPGAVAALEDVVKKFPADTPDSPVPFALYYLVTIYDREGKIAEMAQAADELRKDFPTQDALLLQTADKVSDAYVKQKSFDQAVAVYQPLTESAKTSVAAMARAKMGQVWLKDAKAMGAYQSMQDETQRAKAKAAVDSAEKAFVEVLKNFPGELNAVDAAFQGLDDSLVRLRSWGLLKDGDFEDHLAKLTADLTDAGMRTRVELAKAGVVFMVKDGEKQYPAALGRFRAAIGANPALPLTRIEANRYGELLLDAKDYATAEQVYTALLGRDPNDPLSQADGDFGMGSAFFEQGDYARAKDYFLAMKKLNGGAAWHPHILDAEYGLAWAAEQSGESGELDGAKRTYAMIMQAPQASVDLQAKAMLGYGRILQKEGHTTSPAVAGTIEYAAHYFQQVDTIYGPAVPELSAEGLFRAGQLFDKAGSRAQALKQYQSIETNYKTTAPDWAAKAEAAMGLMTSHP